MTSGRRFSARSKGGARADAHIPMERRVASFAGSSWGSEADAARESRRCLSCGCRKADAA
jgi:hypothetical protein